MNSKFEPAPGLAAHARWVVMCVMFLATARGPAQEAFRTSLAGQAAAEAKQRALANRNFNLRLGPVGLRFQSQLSIEANDNVRLEDNDPKADVIVRPQFNIQGVWRISEKNSLTFSLDLLYQREVGVLGLVFTAVETNASEYYYDTYKDYYSKLLAV